LLSARSEPLAATVLKLDWVPTSVGMTVDVTTSEPPTTCHPGDGRYDKLRQIAIT
jgi:hypothetical protein